MCRPLRLMMGERDILFDFVLSDFFSLSADDYKLAEAYDGQYDDDSQQNESLYGHVFNVLELIVSG